MGRDELRSVPPGRSRSRNGLRRCVPVMCHSRGSRRLGWARSPTLAAKSDAYGQMAGEPGFEPRLPESESGVLPLNYSPTAGARPYSLAQPATQPRRYHLRVPSSRRLPAPSGPPDHMASCLAMARDLPPEWAECRGGQISSSLPVLPRHRRRQRAVQAPSARVAAVQPHHRCATWGSRVAPPGRGIRSCRALSKGRG